MVDLRGVTYSHVQLLVQEGVDQHAAVLICWELQLVAEQGATGSPPLHAVMLIMVAVSVII
jgi:hypothetical protein